MPKKPEYEINKELVVSTIHISAETNEILKTPDAEPLNGLLYVEDYIYGYRICVISEAWGDEYSPSFTSGFHQDLVNLIKIVVEQGCKWLVLDADGTEYDHLETYDW